MTDQLSSCPASSQDAVPQRSLLEDHTLRVVIYGDENVPGQSTVAIVAMPREEIITKAERHSGGKNGIPKNNDEGPDAPHLLSHEVDNFIYQALPAGNYTRRIILEPSKEEDAPLVGRLEAFDLSQDGSGCSFEAISYAWGSDIKDQTITINGRAMHITTSLRDSLRQTRRPDRPRALWADAICINQDDGREKSHQVSLMGQIYMTSRCTLICLGYSAESWPRQVATLMADVVAMIDRVMAGDDPDLKVNLGKFPWLKNGDPLLADKRWHSWAELVMQPWFERGWVVQEAALGPECLVLWSGIEIPWISVLRVACWLNREHGRNRIEALREEGQGVLPHLHLLRYEMQPPQEGGIMASSNTDKPVDLNLYLLENLDAARMLKLKDPKDRIYAFMALPTSDASMPALHISYGKVPSHLDVYRDFATKYMAKNSDLDILGFVDHGDDETLATGPIGCDHPLKHVRSADTFPSWMPRWDRGPMPTACIFTSEFKCRKFDLGSHEIVTILDNNSTLRVKAIIFDSVHYASMVIQEPKRPVQFEEAVASVVSLWKDIAEHSILAGNPHESCLGSAQRFLAALCLGRVSKFLRANPQGLVRALKAFAKLLEADWSQRILSIDTHKKNKAAQDIAASGLNWSGRRRFLVLGRGYYAVSSVATRVGDVCAIISGTRAPFILREITGKKDHYVLVGAAYVQSAMLTDEELPGRMGESERYDDWKQWDLPTRDIFIC